MRDYTFSRICEEYSSHLLHDFEASLGLEWPIDLPIPIDAYASHLGLSIEYSPMIRVRRSTVALLSSGENKIIVRESTELIHQRFAIAHEISHWIRHQGFLNREYGLRENRVIEREANQLAAAILIPADRIYRLCKVLNISQIDVSALDRLAKSFLVSRVVVEIRIRDLSEIGMWKGPKISRIQGLPDASRSQHHTYPPPPSFKKVKELLNNWQGGAHLFDHKAKELPSAYQFDLSNVLRSDKRRITGSGSKSRPRVIEFAGTPRAGKDVAIGELQRYLTREHGLTVKVVDEAVKIRPFPKKSELKRFLHSCLITISTLLEVTESCGFYDVILINRGLFDRLSLLNYYKSIRLISDKQASTLESVITLDYWSKLTDFVFLFIVDPKKSILREKVRIQELNLGNGSSIGNLRKSYDVFSSINELKGLNEAYLSTLDRINRSFETFIYQLDTTSLSKHDFIDSVVSVGESFILCENGQYGWAWLQQTKLLGTNSNV